MSVRGAARMADGLCPATCPDVDKAFSYAERDIHDGIEDCYHQRVSDALAFLREGVKAKGTEKLRAALEDACGQLIEMTSERDDLLKRLESAQEEIADLTREIAKLEETA